MDTTRISIARVLALDVPLTWQDAVAVAQEAAMLSDVHAAMNSRPSLVSAESCFITRTGDLELPVMTDVESPDAVTVLLREMLAGRDAPEALETLAFGHATRDMTGALQQFPIANRRAEIAKLATRALALQAQPLEPLATTAAPVPPAVSLQPPAPSTPAPPPASTRPVLPPVLPPVLSPAPYASTSGSVAVAPTAPPSVVVPFMREAPFRAADVTEPPPSLEPAVAAPAAAPDAELLRLRSKSVARAQARSHWSTRVGLAFGRAAGAVTWRPASPDPRILGAAFVVTAAVVSMLWTGDRRARPAAPAAAVAAVAPPAAAPALPVVPPSTGATGSAGPAGSMVAASPPPLPLAPRPAGRGDVTLRATPASPASAGPSAGPAAAAERLATAPAPARAGVTVTVPALEPAPGPLTTNPGEPRAFAPRPPSSAARADYGTVYSSSDGDVTPPVLLRQQLPSTLLASPEEAPQDWPYLELVVDRAGAVEQVRLRARQPAPGQTLYRHRMLLAAAKAWQFEPARRHGAAVRYVVRVPLEP